MSSRPLPIGPRLVRPHTLTIIHQPPSAPTHFKVLSQAHQRLLVLAETFLCWPVAPINEITFDSNTTSLKQLKNTLFDHPEWKTPWPWTPVGGIRTDDVILHYVNDLEYPIHIEQPNESKLLTDDVLSTQFQGRGTPVYLCFECPLLQSFITQSQWMDINDTDDPMVALEIFAQKDVQSQYGMITQWKDR